MISHTGGEGQLNRYSYDKNGNPDSRIDGRNHVTLLAFDALNGVVERTDAADGVSSFEYNALDRITAVTDAEGLVTRYTRTPLGDLIRLDSPDTGNTAFHLRCGRQSHHRNRRARRDDRLSIRRAQPSHRDSISGQHPECHTDL
ncbi:MAG: RHS repeat protein [Methylococcaceae bacterium]|nr:RHS repeat protein [Methylococcaceae bacterium]